MSKKIECKIEDNGYCVTECPYREGVMGSIFRVGSMGCVDLCGSFRDRGQDYVMCDFEGKYGSMEEMEKLADNMFGKLPWKEKKKQEDKR